MNIKEFFKRDNLDEMQKQTLLKIESRGFCLLWVLLLAALRRSQCVFRPQREEEACLADLARWHRAVERSRSWIENNV